MYRVLFITDHAAERKPLKSALLDHNYSVVLVDSRQVTQEDWTPPKTDVLVIDLERLQADMTKLCHLVRRERMLKDVPMVCLVPEERLGQLDFDLGVDDYLTLPVSPKRLVERLKFLMWKLNKVEISNGLKVGKLAINFERYEVHVNGELVDLTYKEFELLKFLASQPGKVFTREVLLDKVWGYDFYGGTRTVDVHIRRLRSKIETGGAAYIDTIRHVGYKFLAPDAK